MLKGFSAALHHVWYLDKPSQIASVPALPGAVDFCFCVLGWGFGFGGFFIIFFFLRRIKSILNRVILYRTALMPLLEAGHAEVICFLYLLK